MTDINLLIDTTPYTPDIFLKKSIFLTSDAIDYTTYISINSTIFIINLDDSNPIDSIYNDPGYMLYGIEQTNQIYKYPSLYFFSTVLNNLQNPYIVIQSTTIINNDIAELLTNIGYDVDVINTNIFYYALLKVTDQVTLVTKNITYMYFNVSSIFTSSTNYSSLAKTIFTNEKYWNILIYPYVYAPTSQNLYRVNTFSTEPINSSSLTISKISFDNRELIKYVEKIDYKYMENYKTLSDPNNKIGLLKNYSKKIINFEKYYLNSKKISNTLFLNLNEISKFYSNIDYENKYLNTYTIKELNNSYINNNLSFSSNDKKYSFTTDSKFAVLNSEFDTHKYANYNYSTLTINSIYQMVRNYSINCYYNIKQTTDNDIQILNNYLYKILVTINPLIINYYKLTSNDISLKIRNIYDSNPVLEFGFGKDKITLYIKSNLRETNTYYIGVYCIVFSFKAVNSNVILQYDIMLSVAYYNGTMVNISEMSTTLDTDDLGFITYTNQELTVGLSPTIFKAAPKIKLWEDLKYLGMYDTKTYSFIINYDELTKYTSDSNVIYYSNFYYFVSNIIPNLQEFNRQSMSYVNNLFDIRIQKINNLISNIINQSNNFLSIKINNFNKSTILLTSILLDTNLDTKLVSNFQYFPAITLPSTYPPLGTTYKLKYNYNVTSNLNGLVYLPTGYYKILKYINYFPKYDLKTANNSNDHLVLNINSTKNFMENNCCLLIKLPLGANFNDEFYSNNYEKTDFFINNYGFVGNNFTQIFLVAANSSGEPYSSTCNIIYAYELFNYPNDHVDSFSINKFKFKFHLLINSYLNFYQINLIGETYCDYKENNSYILDSDNLNFKLFPDIYLSDIVYYDFYRFNFKIIDATINSQYTNYDPQYSHLLFNAKCDLSQTQLSIRKIIYMLNQNKNLIMINKIKCYLYQIQFIKLSNIDYNIEQWVEAIIFNITVASKINYINYNLEITYSTNNYIIQNLYTNIAQININTSLESIAEYIINCEYIIQYLYTKINLVKINMNQNNNTDYLSSTNELINQLANKLEIEDKIMEKINYDIINIEIQLSKPNPIIHLIINYLQIIKLNTKKIDELLLITRLLSEDKTSDGINPNGINSNVVSMDYIYDPVYSNLSLTNFNCVVFLTNMQTVIAYFSNVLNAPETTNLYYNRAINSGINTYITSTINLFTNLNQQIIGIYKFVYNLTDGTIQPINIYQTDSIANLYYIMTEFKLAYSKMSEIINICKINLFEEFDQVIIYFNEYVLDIKEYLLYVQIKIDMMSGNSDVIIPQDVFYIIGVEELDTKINQVIILFDELLIKTNSTIISEYLDAIQNDDLTNQIIIDKNMFTNLLWGSTDIIIFCDLNIFETNILQYSTSFVFGSEILLICKSYDTAKLTIFNNYFISNIGFYQQLINYNYITNTLKYIDINNA